MSWQVCETFSFTMPGGSINSHKLRLCWCSCLVSYLAVQIMWYHWVNVIDRLQHHSAQTVHLQRAGWWRLRHVSKVMKQLQGKSKEASLSLYIMCKETARSKWLVSPEPLRLSTPPLWDNTIYGSNMFLLVVGRHRNALRKPTQNMGSWVAHRGFEPRTFLLWGFKSTRARHTNTDNTEMCQKSANIRKK